MEAITQCSVVVSSPFSYRCCHFFSLFIHLFQYFTFRGFPFNIMVNITCWLKFSLAEALWVSLGLLTILFNGFWLPVLYQEITLVSPQTFHVNVFHCHFAAVSKKSASTQSQFGMIHRTFNYCCKCNFRIRDWIFRIKSFNSVF